MRFSVVLALVSLLTLSSPLEAQTNGGTGSSLPGTCTTNSIFVLNGMLHVCTATNTWTPMPANVLAKATGVNLNSVADTAMAVPYAKYTVRKFTVTNCSATPTLAQLALYTGAGATGINIVAAALLTTLSAATTLFDMTLATTTTAFTAATIYARNTVANNSALTCDVYVLGDALP